MEGDWPVATGFNLIPIEKPELPIDSPRLERHVPPIKRVFAASPQPADVLADDCWRTGSRTHGCAI